MSATLRKIIDIGPGGVIYPGSAQDLRYAQNLSYLADTGTRWIRMWADWPSLQPHPDYAPGDPRGPGHWRLQALDAQIRLANANGIKVMLMPYRFPTWVNGTAALSARRNTDAEISFRPADRMTRAAWERYVRNGRDPDAYTPSRRALEYLLPDGSLRARERLGGVLRLPLRPLPRRPARLGPLGRRLRARQRAQPAAVAPAGGLRRPRRPVGGRGDDDRGRDRPPAQDRAGGVRALRPLHDALRAVDQRQRHGLQPPLHAL